MGTSRKASAVWEGELATGKGRVALESSGVGNFDVSWPARTEAANGMTSPEELIAAAHASCFSMALSNQIKQAGGSPDRLETTAVCTIDRSEGGLAITDVALTVRGQVTGMDETSFAQAADAAKQGCPVSKMMAGNVQIHLDAQLGARS